MAGNSKGLSVEHYHGDFHFAGPGYDITTMRGKRGDRTTYAGVVLLKGGLGDPSSDSMFGIAEEVVKISEGDVVAAVVGTTRPTCPLTAFRNLANPRKHQSQSVFKASDYLNDRFHAPVLVQAGQSRGSVSVVDGGLYQAKHPDKSRFSPHLGVVTIDGPGIFGPFTRNHNLLIEGVKLGLHCLEDLSKLHPIEQLKLFGKVALKTSVYEPYYFASDVNYLKDIDISGKIAALRSEGVEVRHIFHDQDVIPGAEVECEHSLILPGGHLRFMVEPTPVAEHLAAFVYDLHSAYAAPKAA